MARPTLKVRSASDQITTIVRYTLQGTLALAILWVVYRYCWIDASDPFKCAALLHKGAWLDPGPRWSSRSPFQNWQPPGCMMYEYKRRNIHECLHKRKLIFVGDSTIRQIFWAVAQKMDQKKADEEIADMLAQDVKHTNLDFEVDGVSINFIWDPWLNSTGLDRELKKFSAFSPLEYTGASGESAALLLLGAPGLWFARHNQENFMKDFRDSIEHAIPYMDHAHDNEDNLPTQQFSAREASPNLLLLAPIQVPQYEFLSPSRAATITPEKIDQMNDFLQQASAYSEADVVWSYNLMTWNGDAQYEEDGLHVVENVAHRKADVLLNLRCNAGSASSKYPFDHTCCSNYTHPNYIQWALIVVGMLILPCLLSLRRAHVSWLGKSLPSTQSLSTLITFCLVICFCYYADRTQIFEKSQKQFHPGQFAIACLATGIGGLPLIRKNKDSRAASRTGAIYDQPFLAREQTEEWKGWMQFIILIYHYTHGSQILWIYELVRILIASYLFMTGFGHATYFLKTRDYSLRRVASVLVRLNLLSCALPYMMRTDYMFYYFASLVSFWFLVIYFTLRIGHSRNSDSLFFIGKLVLSSAVGTCFTKIPGILESMSLVLHKTCAITLNVEEWRFRTSLDLYIVYIGMLFAALTIRRSQFRSGVAMPINLVDTTVFLTVKYRRTFKVTALILSIGLTSRFWSFAQKSPNKKDYNSWHPYISFIPIICFVCLRNCNRLLRNYHSVVFAWLGRCSLETYVLQYHIWLAADTKGLLSLGLKSRWADAFILTLIFVWLSWHTAKATQTITEWIVRRKNSSPISDEDTVKDSPYLPPETQDGGQPHMEDLALEGQRMGTGSRMRKHLDEVNDDIRWRLGLMVLLMWFGNITYR